MKTSQKYGLLIGCLFFATTLFVHGQSQTLNETLYQSVCERVQAPVVFSTRDTLFALSLPTDEQATIALRVTVGKNGKVKEKMTRVDANHIAGYVAPAFIEATKDLRVDRSLLGDLAGKDTSLLLTFPLEYQCVLDTMTKVLPVGDLADRIATPFYIIEYHGGLPYPASTKERDKEAERQVMRYPDAVQKAYLQSDPTRVWYYLAFIKDQPE